MINSIKTLTLALLTTLLLSCLNKDYMSNKHGEIKTHDVENITYYSSGQYPPMDSTKIGIHTLTDMKKMSELISEINQANKPGPWKGAHWDKIVIKKKDTTLIFSTNGKVIGLNHSSGEFYHLKDEYFIKRHFLKH